MEKGTMNKRKAVNGILSTFTALAMLAQGLCFSTITRTPKVNADINLPDGKLAMNSSITYDSGDSTYKLQVDVTGNVVSGEYKEYLGVSAVNHEATTSGSFTIPTGCSGVYAIQLRGGHGGNAGNATNTNGGSSRTAIGGTGAAGAEVKGYIHIDAGTTINYTIGTNGSNTDSETNSDSVTRAVTKGGGAGTFSTVSIGGTGYVVAGGGGGGGGAAAGRSRVFNGGSAVTNSMTTQYYETATILYVATKGEDGPSVGVLESDAADAGNSGRSYNGLPSNASLTSEASAIYTSLADLTDEYASIVITCLQLDTPPVLPTLEEVKTDLASKTISNLALTASLSDYFEIIPDSVSMTNGSMTNSSSGNSIYITNIVPNISFSGENTPPRRDIPYDCYTITASADFSITVKMKPKAGFLGGNDVPLTTTGVTLTKSGSGSVSAGSATNVNVPIADFAISTQDITITCGETVTMGDMVTNLPSTPAAADAWKYDYVTVSGLTGSISPKVTTTYTDFEVSISPKTSTPTSTIGATATAKTAKGTATCYVDHTVSYQLTNIEAKSSETVKAADDFSTTIKASTNYELPETITVKVGSTTLAASEYTYTRNADKTEGTIAIVRAKITDNVQISAIGYVPEDVISVTVEWNDMSFDLTRTDTWNPESHDYGEAHVTTEPSAIKVTNNSSIRVLVELSYTPNTGYESLTGSFTWDNTANPTPVSGNAFTLEKGIPDEQAETVYFCLNGSLDREDGEDLNCGKITVSLSKVTG